MIARRFSSVIVAFAVAVTLLAGCSSASSTPAVCTDVANLKTSVTGLKDINVKEQGVSAVTDELNKIKGQLTTLKNDAKGQYSSEIDAMSTAIDGLTTSINAAKGSANATTLGAVATAAHGVVTAGNNLITAVSHTC
jgi:outer membrane murein-binding lipoprotein Lpp